MGSKSDWPTMEHAALILKEFKVPHEIRVISAHRTPKRMNDFSNKAEKRGIKIIIAGAGGAAHLPGMTASQTKIPVLGVPIKSKQLDGIDCVLADVRWPEGAAQILNEAKNREIIRIFDGDVATAEVLKTLAPLATHSIFSEPGFCLYSGKEDVRKSLIENAVKFDGCMGVTLGADGFIWVEDGVLRQIYPPQIIAKDTLAAGDVFHGAFAIAITEGMSIEKAAMFACSAAAIKCSRFGGRKGIANRNEVELLMQATYA